MEGLGKLRSSQEAQRITIVALRRRGQATYTLVAFRNRVVPARLAGPLLREMARSVRGRPPS